MSFLQEAVLRRYFGFLLGFLALLTGFGIFCGTAWVRAEQEVLLAHDRAFASSLLEEDVPPVAIVRALKQAQETEQGAALLREAGWTEQTGALFFPRSGRRPPGPCPWPWGDRCCWRCRCWAVPCSF